MGIVREQVPSTRGLGGLDPDSGSVAGVRELHVSLTRPFFLCGHQREEMKRAVRGTLPRLTLREFLYTFTFSTLSSVHIPPSFLFASRDSCAR
ncbi:hypothetical protein B0F90DRAFT_1774550 [Multifurca ochricompacta]|uniref:Uncharacterized protein n=1 Tax=Multifurca ochricompacta TaxID=376703 RepID=A0AAD4QFD7_9AGAM|nr:hypothetical protein B0F90DRAFT_1774550 [Multifurca ochricompacta]